MVDDSGSLRAANSASAIQKLLGSNPMDGNLARRDLTAGAILQTTAVKEVRLDGTEGGAAAVFKETASSSLQETTRLGKKIGPKICLATAARRKDMKKTLSPIQNFLVTVFQDLIGLLSALY
jgi:hypothetical protein